jgi:hypothetical protein
MGDFWDRIGNVNKENNKKKTLKNIENETQTLYDLEYGEKH